MKKRYFKVKIGYGENEFVAIDEDELQTAFHAYLTDAKAVFRNGIARGKDIIAITEDWHKAMGWNYAHVLGQEDWAQLERDGVKRQYAGVIETAKNHVKTMIETNQTHLIGKTIVPERPKEIKAGVKELADKFKIKNG